MKKVVVLGGGNGLSTLLRGLKQFPLDLTAIVSVCDDGASSGILRKEFNTPAMGDITLVAEMIDGEIVEGEHNITEANKIIKKVYYKNEPEITPEAIKAIKKADLVILSVGSLYTSIIPNIIPKEMKEALKHSKAKIMYVCNIMTQPGETDKYKVSDHVNKLNEYLDERKIDVVIANKGKIEPNIITKYSSLEQKDPVILDKQNLKGVEIISDDLVKVEEGSLRHDSLKLSLDIFSYLLK